MSYRSLLGSLALSLLVVQACGSDSGKNAKRGEEGGAGGESSGGEPSKGGSESMAGMPAGGAPIEATGGAGGAPETDGGAAGSPNPPLVPVPELLFTVKAGALGLANTGVNAQSPGNPQNSIYSSKTGAQEVVDGTNLVVITGASLGLEPEDRITSFTELRPEPQHPVYLFSVADGAEGGGYGNRVDREDMWDGTEEGDVYFSEGTASFRPNYNESGDLAGYNAMLATEVSLGLVGAHDGPPDDLGDIVARDANVPISELYFTVAYPPQGLARLADVAPGELGCTIFKSSLDGKNSVAFTCQQLGLAPGDQIDGLLVYGTTVPDKVVFSVSNGSLGADGSALKAAYDAGDEVGAKLFESSDGNTNTLFKTESELGLGDPNYYEDIDGLSVLDEAPPPAVKASGSCTLTFDPLDPTEGGLSVVTGSTHIGDDVLVVLGTKGGTAARAIAYDVNDCTQLQAVDLPFEFADPYNIAIVPLAGWSAAKPLDKVEYLNVVLDGAANYEILQRFDAAGVFQKSHNILNLPNYSTIRGLIHDAPNDRLYVINVYGYPSHNQLWSTAMPGVDTTDLTATAVELVMPCMWETRVSGLDADGNLLFAEPQGNFSQPWESFRVCKYNPAGGLLSLPYSWPNQGNRDTAGFIAKSGQHVLLKTNQGAGPFSIERATQ